MKHTRGERTGQIPYGYVLAADGVHLEENAAEQAVIGQIRAFRAAGLSLRAVTVECERRGAATSQRRQRIAWAVES